MLLFWLLEQTTATRSGDDGMAVASPSAPSGSGLPPSRGSSARARWRPRLPEVMTRSSGAGDVPRRDARRGRVHGVPQASPRGLRARAADGRRETHPTGAGLASKSALRVCAADVRVPHGSGARTRVDVLASPDRAAVADSDVDAPRTSRRRRRELRHAGADRREDGWRRPGASLGGSTPSRVPVGPGAIAPAAGALAPAQTRCALTLGPASARLRPRPRAAPAVALPREPCKV